MTIATIDWNAAAAMGAILAAVIAIGALIHQIRAAKLTRQIEIIMQLEDRYRSNEFRHIRAAAAKSLIESTNGTLLHAYPNPNIDRLLGFYEFIGLLCSTKVVNDYYIWHAYSTAISYYKVAANTYIQEANKKNKAVYSDFITLFNRMVDIEKRESGHKHEALNPSIEDCILFLSAETIATESGGGM